MCLPCCIYNCCSWVAPKAVLNNLDACHRSHLLASTGHTCTAPFTMRHSISNATPDYYISKAVTEAKWKMLDHFLCMDQNVPVQNAKCTVHLLMCTHDSQPIAACTRAQTLTGPCPCATCMCHHTLLYVYTTTTTATATLTTTRCKQKWWHQG